MLNTHCLMKQFPSFQIGWKVLPRNHDLLKTVTANKGFDWDTHQQKLAYIDVRPGVRHPGFYHLDQVHNARMNDVLYHLRSNIHSAVFAINHRYGDRLRARTWFDQFREFVRKVTVENIGMAVRA